MKNFALSLLVLSCGISLAAQQLAPAFSLVINVTATSANGNSRPRVVLIHDSVPLVMWGKSASVNGAVFVSTWNGSAFGAATQISPSGLSVYVSPDEGGDIAAKGDTLYAVFFTTDSRCYSVHSYDAGVTWSDTVRVDHQLEHHNYTPDVQIDRNGNPVVAFEASDNAMAVTHQMVCRSYDGGNTFTMEQYADVNVAGVPCECCPPSLLINDSMTYVIYRNNDNNFRDIVMTISSDSGMTFPVVSEVDQNNWLITSCPVAGAEGAFYRDSVLVFWKSGNKLWYGCGHAQTGATGPDRLLEPSLSASVLQKHPFVLTLGDTVIYLWDDRRSSNYNCYVSIFANGPQPVTLPFIVNDTIASAENGTQQTPHMAVYGNTLHIVYQDVATGLVKYRKGTIAGVVGVEEPAAQLSPVIFPVPAKESFTITGVDEPFAVTVYAVNGAVAATYTQVVSGQPLPLHDLAPGMYTVLITTESGAKSSVPLVKQ